MSAKGTTVLFLSKLALVAVGVVLITGALFFTGVSEQYLSAPAWRAKLLFLSIAIANIAVFETTHGARVLSMTAAEKTPTIFRVAGAVSIVSWFAVLYFGRMLPFIGGVSRETAPP
jgi:hypothetical protein